MNLIIIISHMQISLPLYVFQRNAAPYSYAAYSLISTIIPRIFILELRMI